LSYLSASYGLSFLDAFPIEDPNHSDWSEEAFFRYRNWHFWINGRHGSIPLNRSIPGGLDPFGGSMQWGLSRDAVVHITNFVEREPRYVKFFRHTFVPDEMFFHTILMNSELRHQITTLSAPCCYGLHYIEWLPNQDHPETLRLSDVAKLRSTPALFARKFDCSVDSEVLDAIDSELLA
jgi:core-2/I-Branching enzyme